MADRNDMASPENGYFDIVHSPDDGGWYADLLFNKHTDPPIFDSDLKAIGWAARNGGKRRLA